MSAGAHPRPNPRGKPGLLEKFRGELARDGLRFGTATFADARLEAEYQAHICGVSFPVLRLFCVGGPVVWFLFGVLDLLTVKEGGGTVALIRWLIVGPISVALVLALFSRTLQKYYEWIIAAGLTNFSFGIVAMIAAMPSAGAPPYIIGILVTFAYASCFMRIRFRIAAGAYTAIAAAYCGMLAALPKFTSVDTISGYYFMVNIALVAILTHYAQEVRSRQIWKRNRQQTLDAAYIEELLIEATAADQSKLNFISILSHELRTPLHQIIGFTEVVMQRIADGDSSKNDEFLGDIRTSAHDLLSRIAKMLRYADATAGKIKYEPEATSARDLAETILTQSKGLALAKAIEIDVSGVKDDTLWVDHPHTAYALGHIVENALKASNRGSRVVIRGAGWKEGGYRLEIEDFGIGMSPDQIRAAFEPFSQVEQVRTRTLDGIGLGLTLARKIFQDQGAELEIQSRKGEGTTVTIEFRSRPRDSRTAAA